MNKFISNLKNIYMTFNEVIKESISNNHRLEISYKDYNGKNSLTIL